MGSTPRFKLKSDILVLHLQCVVQLLVLYVYGKHFQQDGVIPLSSTAQLSLTFLLCICKDTRGFPSSQRVPKEP